MLENILKMKWQDKIWNVNEELCERMIQEDTEQEFGSWIGHTLRKPSKYVTQQALQWNLQGKRGRGGSHETWKSNVEKDMSPLTFNWNDVGWRVQNSYGWILLWHSLYTLPKSEAH